MGRKRGIDYSNMKWIYVLIAILMLPSVVAQTCNQQYLSNSENQASESYTACFSQALTTNTINVKDASEIYNTLDAKKQLEVIKSISDLETKKELLKNVDQDRLKVILTNLAIPEKGETPFGNYPLIDAMLQTDLPRELKEEVFQFTELNQLQKSFIKFAVTPKPDGLGLTEFIMRQENKVLGKPEFIFDEENGLLLKNGNSELNVGAIVGKKVRVTPKGFEIVAIEKDGKSSKSFLVSDGLLRSDPNDRLLLVARDNNLKTLDISNFLDSVNADEKETPKFDFSSNVGNSGKTDSFSVFHVATGAKLVITNNENSENIKNIYGMREGKFIVQLFEKSPSTGNFIFQKEYEIESQKLGIFEAITGVKNGKPHLHFNNIKGDTIVKVNNQNSQTVTKGISQIILKGQSSYQRVFEGTTSDPGFVELIENGVIRTVSGHEKKDGKVSKVEREIDGIGTTIRYRMRDKPISRLQFTEAINYIEKIESDGSLILKSRQAGKNEIIVEEAVGKNWQLWVSSGEQQVPVTTTLVENGKIDKSYTAFPTKATFEHVKHSGSGINHKFYLKENDPDSFGVITKQSLSEDWTRASDGTLVKSVKIVERGDIHEVTYTKKKVETDEFGSPSLVYQDKKGPNTDVVQEKLNEDIAVFANQESPLFIGRNQANSFIGPVMSLKGLELERGQSQQFFMRIKEGSIQELYMQRWNIQTEFKSGTIKKVDTEDQTALVQGNLWSLGGVQAQVNLALGGTEKFLFESQDGVLSTNIGEVGVKTFGLEVSTRGVTLTLEGELPKQEVFGVVKTSDEHPTTYTYRYNNLPENGELGIQAEVNGRLLAAQDENNPGQEFKVRVASIDGNTQVLRATGSAGNILGQTSVTIGSKTQGTLYKNVLIQLAENNEFNFVSVAPEVRIEQASILSTGGALEIQGEDVSLNNPTSAIISDLTAKKITTTVSSGEDTFTVKGTTVKGLKAFGKVLNLVAERLRLGSATVSNKGGLTAFTFNDANVGVDGEISLNGKPIAAFSELKGGFGEVRVSPTGIVIPGLSVSEATLADGVKVNNLYLSGAVTNPNDPQGRSVTLRAFTESAYTNSQAGADPIKFKAEADHSSLQFPTSGRAKGQTVSDYTKQVQVALKEIGEYNGAIDGIPGTGTKAGIKKVQQELVNKKFLAEAKNAVDGVWGKNTGAAWAKYQQSLEEKKSLDLTNVQVGLFLKNEDNELGFSAEKVKGFANAMQFTASQLEGTVTSNVDPTNLAPNIDDLTKRGLQALYEPFIAKGQEGRINLRTGQLEVTDSSGNLLYGINLPKDTARFARNGPAEIDAFVKDGEIVANYVKGVFSNSGLVGYASLAKDGYFPATENNNVKILDKNGKEWATIYPSSFSGFTIDKKSISTQSDFTYTAPGLVTSKSGKAVASGTASVDLTLQNLNALQVAALSLNAEDTKVLAKNLRFTVDFSNPNIIKGVEFKNAAQVEKSVQKSGYVFAKTPAGNLMVSRNAKGIVTREVKSPDSLTQFFLGFMCSGKHGCGRSVVNHALNSQTNTPKKKNKELENILSGTNPDGN